MSPPGRPKGEYRRAEPEGSKVNAPIPAIWTTGTTEVIRTGTWRAAWPRHIAAPSPCHQACPVNGDIAEWIGLARAGDWRGAFEVLSHHNPFPAVAGRICHHPCETACNRAGYDEPLAICKLERAVGDIAIDRGWQHPMPVLERKERVAVVGAGPAGLSAAYQLRRRGWQVSLYEASDELGGLMRHGIPSYRLARSVLDAEIARIVALGVDVRVGQRLNAPDAWSELRETHAAVVLAVGAQRQKRLPALDYAKPWVVDGARYLAAANAGRPPALGRRLVVVGGGSAALDAARSARRAGHEVTILALEARDQMPAQREEVDEALEEGISIVGGAMLKSASEAVGGTLKLDCTRVRFVPGAVRGQFTLEAVPGGDFELAADALVTSIGQDPELAALGQPYTMEGSVLAIDACMATGIAGVWAGGDVASMARFVTEAVGMGKRAALAIDRTLREAAGEAAQIEARLERPPRTPLALPREEPVPLSAIAKADYGPAPRAQAPHLDAQARLACGDEVQLGFDTQQALAEAARCFSCGSCIQCDNCVIYCPDMAVTRVEGGYRVNGDYCKGCGLCVKECPTGSMDMVEEAR